MNADKEEKVKNAIEAAERFKTSCGYRVGVMYKKCAYYHENCNRMKDARKIINFILSMGDDGK